jgi:hypothetical protein
MRTVHGNILNFVMWSGLVCDNSHEKCNVRGRDLSAQANGMENKYFDDSSVGLVNSR